MNQKRRKKIGVLPMILALVLLLEITACGADADVEPTVSPTGNPSAALSVAVPSDFDDVPKGEWYAEAINYCRQHSIMNGVYSPGLHTLFQPAKQPGLRRRCLRW